MNNEERLLRLYYDPYASREVLQQPFLQDGKVCATEVRARREAPRENRCR